ncbi:hypothetical protein HOLleu_13962 [Holothuria leucospilota]|uniref:C2H2-type domain-containing protein n=1 Tax=Holothuria leucospilota TaxID=206669 RepID=A0A9Q1C7H0_HOLLE|nr:hypothetical protein HOLleu_13962 [Holothuria leucospilota]
MAGEPSQSNQSSHTSEKLEAIKLGVECVEGKRRNPENEFDISREDEREQRAARKSHPNRGKGVPCEYGCGKAFADRQKMKQHLWRVHNQTRSVTYAVRRTVCGQKATKGGRCGPSKPCTSVITMADESSSAYADPLTEAAEGNRSIVEDGVEIGGGEGIGKMTC